MPEFLDRCHRPLLCLLYFLILTVPNPHSSKPTRLPRPSDGGFRLIIPWAPSVSAGGCAPLFPFSRLYQLRSLLCPLPFTLECTYVLEDVDGAGKGRSDENIIL